jgi:hypothetical protein
LTTRSFELGEGDAAFAAVAELLESAGVTVES